MKGASRALGRTLGLLALALLALQLVLLARIALWRFVDPSSTSFQRSELLRLIDEKGRPLAWQQTWIPYERIDDDLKRAVVASEDAGFVDHAGLEWEAIQQARARNLRAEQRAAEKLARARARAERRAKRRGEPVPEVSVPPPPVVGASTISQQLVKNLLLSPERSMLRKAEEVPLTLAMELLLPKQRILEIYLNHVEWGEGVFGAEAAAQHHMGTGADRLTPAQAARLAAMLPAPKKFDREPNSPQLAARASAIVRQIRWADLPED